MHTQNDIRLTWLFRILAAGLLAAMILLPIARQVSAAEFITGEPDVIIGEDEVIEDDLFASGRRIEISGVVQGDLFATGQEVIIDGVVEGTVFITGQYLTVGGEIDGSLLASGYSLTLEPDAYVSRSVYFAGFGLEAEEGAFVERGLYLTGYQLILDGDVNRDLTVAAGAVELNGTVGGDAIIQVSETPEDEEPNFGFWEAFMPGGLRMIDPGFREGEDSQVGGNIEFSTTEIQTPSIETPRPGAFLGLAIAGWLRRRVGEFLAVLIIGALMLRFLPSLMQSARTYAQENILPSAGYGCLSLIVFAIGVPLAFGLILLAAFLGGLVTLGALFGKVMGVGTATLGLIIAIFSITVSLASKAVIAFLGGRMLFGRFAPDVEPGQFWNEVLFLGVGALIYALLRSIPLGLGLLVGVIVTLVGLGAIIYTLWMRWFPTKGKASAKASAS